MANGYKTMVNIEKIEEKLGQDTQGEEKTDKKADQLDLVGGDIVEQAIANAYLDFKLSNINQDQFNKKIASLFKVDSVEIKESRDDKGEVSKLEIMDGAGNLLAYFDLKKLDESAEEARKREEEPIFGKEN